jgi:SAM-dependent methyltransferase
VNRSFPKKTKKVEMLIDSPLVVGAKARLIGSIDSRTLIQGYHDELGHDVSSYFADVPLVEVYECERSGYRFYHPFSLVGREELYQYLQQFDWNYKPNKWEYQRAAALIKKPATVLDVGCGKGAFLKIAKEHDLDGFGLELNSHAADVARKNGLKVSVQMIDRYATENQNSYDAVCSFQVLEHIPDVRPFIEACILATKPGGTLIFGVPNNDGFLKYADAVLNSPPHHMGLWTEASLRSLDGIFPIKLLSIETEPLAEIDWYVAVAERRRLKNTYLRAAYFKLGLSNLTRKVVAAKAHRIPGHTILAVYKKV